MPDSFASRKLLRALVQSLALVALWAAGSPARAAAPVRVIYSTDLFHPHDDPDDHFDIAALFALPHVEVAAILLDLGDRQKARPGKLPVEQIFTLSGRRVPYATGFARPLTAPGDQGLDRPADEQGAIALLLQTLRESPAPVRIVAVGSLRDLCAAFNREPELFRAKVERFYLVAGAATAMTEWNSGLDPFAYEGIMASGLPLYWAPCEPKEATPHTSYWKFRQSAVLEGLPAPILNFMIYALQRVDPNDLDPQAALTADLRPWRHALLRDEREMWSIAPMLHAAGYTVQAGPNGYALVPTAADPVDPVFTFTPVKLERGLQGVTYAIQPDAASNVRGFTAWNRTRYTEAMTQVLRELLMKYDRIPAN